MNEVQRFVLDRVSSPLGTILLVCDDEDRLRALNFEEFEERTRNVLRRHYGEDGYTLTAGRAASGVRDALDAFFAGELDAIGSIPVRTGGTEFQLRVWAALRRIPAGATTSYGELAHSIGSPGASRAVGLANGANPVGVVVPCHRVIGANGTLTGYGGGLERKRWLLAHERKWADVGRRASA